MFLIKFDEIFLTFITVFFVCSQVWKNKIIFLYLWEKKKKRKKKRAGKAAALPVCHRAGLGTEAPFTERAPGGCDPETDKAIL